MFKFNTRTLVATAIGAALFTVLFMYVKFPTGVANTLRLTKNAAGQPVLAWSERADATSYYVRNCQPPWPGPSGRCSLRIIETVTSAPYTDVSVDDANYVWYDVYSVNDCGSTP